VVLAVIDVISALAVVRYRGDLAGIGSELSWILNVAVGGIIQVFRLTGSIDAKALRVLTSRAILISRVSIFSTSFGITVQRTQGRSLAPQFVNNFQQGSGSSHGI